ncbi:TetR family transcriptional regulator [Amycolatopsis sp., V23-08]|uniref:TetR family transcriptional regulator n=1 Tax=Amycolatopsis heterodermiae TaxID=3110235 RepID=A0ABU5R4D8_9PSEU|nr:TetR family transcriptional regulator [Amycolatopsis sp., V23-08]MEA5361073.1 TetR family transcriptional regulator [Amycolatopsis sp., V23-08]
MTEADTRARILRAALEEFSERGYHATSVRELAERVGVTKTAVLYHFPGKADIVTALAEPLLDDLETTMGKAAAAPDPREAAIAGLLDVWLSHRYLLRMNLRDLGLTASKVVFERFRDGMLKANQLVAGPDADLAGQVRGAQAIAMLSDPVVLFADAPVDELRAAVLDGVARLFGTPAASRGRRGRPSVMSPETIEAAHRLYDTGHSAADIATALGVSRATIYRHLPEAE